ncbi:MAG TPA: hypothetical protein VFE15_04310 [Marmoricola sp.]|jgi:hypothetical protein|nr:hypothetical protein [Marmoricola sp.]
MIKKALVGTSFAAGYVLGAKAGRERYEQIRKVALRIKDDPHVQDAAGQAAEFTKEHGAALVDKVVVGEHAARDTIDGISNPYQRATP